MRVVVSGGRVLGSAPGASSRRLALGLLVMLVIGLGAAFASRSVAQEQALEDSERMTRAAGRRRGRPAVAGYGQDAGCGRRADRTVHSRMADGNLTEVTVWSADGVVLYSNKAEDIGKQPAARTGVPAGHRRPDRLRLRGRRAGGPTRPCHAGRRPLPAGPNASSRCTRR